VAHAELLLVSAMAGEPRRAALRPLPERRVALCLGRLARGAVRSGPLAALPAVPVRAPSADA